MLIGAHSYLAIALCLLPGAMLRAAPSAQGRAAEMEHIREELGINEFTAPSIALVFDQLEELKPLPFDKVWRDLPDTIPQDRPRLALCAGQTIANGFLAVAANKQSRVESVGRHLLRLAKGLGVGDPISKRSKGVIELAATNRWSDLKTELIKAQADVEGGMMALKDEEIAHLVSLGGWVRALEITSSVLIESYSPERARTLVQPELFDYFLERIATLNPTLRATPLLRTIQSNVAQIQKLTTRPVDSPIPFEDVQKIRDWAREINKAITTLPDEAPRP